MWPETSCEQEVTSVVCTAVSSLSLGSLQSIIHIERHTQSSRDALSSTWKQKTTNDFQELTAGVISEKLHAHVEASDQHQSTSKLPLAGLDSLSSGPLVLTVLVEVGAQGRS